MKVRLVVTDAKGNTYEGEATLVATGGTHPRGNASARKPRATMTVRVGPDFSLPMRAFMKRHAKGLGGPQKFTLLVAKLSRGKIGPGISLGELEKAWNRMTALMGKFNPAYTTRAKDNGWVDTPKTGHYALRSSWTGALDG